MKHFTLESASLHSIQEKNVLNSQTFYFSILFQRSFLSAFRGLLSRDIPSLELCIPFTVYFYSFHTFVTSFTHFLCIYIACAEYFLIPDDAVDRPKVGFQISLFKQQFKASLEQFYIFNYAADGQHEQIKSHTVLLAATEEQSQIDRIMSCFKLKVVVHVLKLDGLTEVMALASLDDLCKY